MQKTLSLFSGILLTGVVAYAARLVAQISYLSILGPMITAILLGMLLRSLAGPALEKGQAGISFSAATILRLGIILMGIRLNINEIIAAGWQMILLDILVILFALGIVTLLGKMLKVEQDLTMLLAVGTGVCGAAAIGAVAPVIKAKEQDTAVAVAIIAILGTVFTIAYTALLPLLGLSPHFYGTFVGSTLQELGHVIAASAPDGQDSSSVAVLVKLGRVAFLAPVALIIRQLYAKRHHTGATRANLPIPWFIFGFLAMAAVNTLGLIPAGLTGVILDASTFLLVMAMAAMGLNVRYADFLQTGIKPILISFFGAVLLSGFGRTVIWMLTGN